ncbi:MAG: hypothetical protein WBB67_05935 [bacterium]
MKVHLYEVKLTNGTVYRGEIVQHDNTTVWLRFINKETIRLSINGIMVIKDSGWEEV